MSQKSLINTSISEIDAEAKLEEILLNKQNIPIKSKIIDIDYNIVDVKVDINKNHKRKNIITEELKTLQLNAMNKVKNITNLIREDLRNFSLDLDQIRQHEVEQNKNLEEQIKYLKEDDKNLARALSSINRLVTKQEDSIGMDFYK